MTGDRSKFGAVELVDAADSEKTVWEFANDGGGGVDTKTFPSSASEIFMSSSSSSDSSIVVKATVCDESFNESQQVVQLSGQTPVSIGTWLDSNRIEVIGPALNVGSIYLTNTSSFTSGVPDDLSSVLAYVSPGQGQTHQCTYLVPAGRGITLKKAVITVARASGAAGSAIIDLRTKISGADWVIKRRWHLQTGDFQHEVPEINLPPGSNFEIRLEDVSDNDTNVSAEVIFSDL